MQCVRVSVAASVRALLRRLLLPWGCRAAGRRCGTAVRWGWGALALTASRLRAVGSDAAARGADEGVDSVHVRSQERVPILALEGQASEAVGLAARQGVDCSQEGVALEHSGGCELAELGHRAASKACVRGGMRVSSVCACECVSESPSVRAARHAAAAPGPAAAPGRWCGGLGRVCTYPQTA